MCKLPRCKNNMSDLDSNIANGTCYYGYNQAAGDELVPCGNGGIDHVPCCFGGDYCDANNSCYDDDSKSFLEHNRNTGGTCAVETNRD